MSCQSELSVLSFLSFPYLYRSFLLIVLHGLAVDLWCRKQLQLEFLDHGVLTLLKNWLEPLPDGSLPNINIRAAVLRILNDVCIGYT